MEITEYAYQPQLTDLDTQLTNYIAVIEPLDEALIQQAQKFCDQLAKPIGSLGNLEKLYTQLTAIYQEKPKVNKMGILIYISDNGVCQEGISNNPPKTTKNVAEAIVNHKSTVALPCDHYQVEYEVVDVGSVDDVIGSNLKYKIVHGTKDFVRTSALSHEEALKGILAGIHMAEEKIQSGWNVLGTGEMGVGNTTTSAAVLSVLLDESPEVVTGYGAGLSPQQLLRKIEVIKQGVAFHQPFVDGLDVAAKVGGLDILAIAGTFLACAKNHVPCVVDGVISVAGLAVAATIAPDCLDYALFSHISAEPAFQLASQKLQLKNQPLLALNMRVGEGTGCPFLFELIKTSIYLMENLPTFGDWDLSQADYIDIRPDSLN